MGVQRPLPYLQVEKLMPKRTGAQGAGERVGEVVQLTGKLSRWRVRDTPLSHTHKSILT